MGEVQWIKIYIDMFDKRKIKKVRRLPAGNDLLLIWIMLLAMAGKCNAGGMIYITENVPFTEEDLADELDFEVNTIRLALKAFEELDMITTTPEGYINVIGWEEHQNVDKLAEIREQTRRRVADHRARKKQELATGKECAYCGRYADTIDHIIPRSKGGTDVEENIVPCCKSCNSSKKDKDLADFLNDSFILTYQKIDHDRVRANERLMRHVRYDFSTLRYSNATVTQCNGIEEEGEKDKEKESHSFTLCEEAKRKLLGGTLGKGVVMLSDEQIEDLLDKLSLEEFDKYVSIVAECELNGKPYKKKTHYQAILDMASQDRRIK